MLDILEILAIIVLDMLACIMRNLTTCLHDRKVVICLEITPYAVYMQVNVNRTILPTGTSCGTSF